MDGGLSNTSNTTLTPQMERLFPSGRGTSGTSMSSRTFDEREKVPHDPAASEAKAAAPATPMTGAVLAGGSAAQVRGMVQQCLAQGITHTACILADRLLRLQGSVLADIVLFARCFQARGEPRRCLAALEHKGLLGAQVLAELSDTLSPKANPNRGGGEGGPGAGAGAVVSPCFFDYLDAVHIAAQCLFGLEQYDDCINLVEPLLFIESGDDSITHAAALRARTVCRHEDSDGTTNGSSSNSGRSNEVNVMASVYSIAGKSYDLLENKTRAATCLATSLQVDPACTEAAEYIIENGLLDKAEKRRVFESLLDLQGGGRQWLQDYYKFTLLEEVSEQTERDLWGVLQGSSSSSSSGSSSSSSNSSSYSNGGASLQGVDVRLSSIVLVKRAEWLCDNQYPAEAYRLARQAYIMDPFDTKGLVVYIASMVELKLTTELFYLGHELSKTYPRQSSSWYAVGCYYWICRKLEHAQKYIQKAIKLNKRSVHAWLVLGHVLAAQEESEHAISAFRTASRLLPGDHRPLMYMAKEMVRTNYLPLALHLLGGALRIRPHDPAVLNELGVVFLKQDRLDEALDHLGLAASVVQSNNDRSLGGGSSGGGGGGSAADAATGKVCGDEIFSNYATALRRAKRYEEALEWYELCLAVNPSSADTHAHLGFTQHLLGRLNPAINSYHKALAMQPSFQFCSDMLLRAMEEYQFADGDEEDWMHPPTAAAAGGLGAGINGSTPLPAHLNFDISDDSSRNMEI